MDTPEERIGKKLDSIRNYGAVIIAMFGIGMACQTIMLLGIKEKLDRIEHAYAGIDFGKRYVSPETGDDRNDGLTGKTPKRTLQGALKTIPYGGGCIYLDQSLYSPLQEIVEGGK